MKKRQIKQVIDQKEFLLIQKKMVIYQDCLFAYNWIFASRSDNLVLLFSSAPTIACCFSFSLPMLANSAR